MQHSGFLAPLQEGGSSARPPSQPGGRQEQAAARGGQSYQRPAAATAAPAAATVLTPELAVLPALLQLDAVEARWQFCKKKCPSRVLIHANFPDGMHAWVTTLPAALNWQSPEGLTSGRLPSQQHRCHHQQGQ